MFYSCECGYYNCGICGPVIESINKINKEKERIAQKKMEKLNKLASKSIMPFGKYKGKRLYDIPRSYLSWVINNCNLKDSKLKEIIHFLLQDYRPSHSYITFDYMDDEGFIDPQDFF